MLPLIAFGLGGCFQSCSPGPSTDTCTQPLATGVTQIEQGLASVTDSELTPFVPLSNPAYPPIVRGGQGLTMIVTRLRFSGPDVPVCVDQASELVDAINGSTVASLDGPLNTYAEPGTTSRTTKPMYLPGYALIGRKHFTSRVAGLSVTNDLLIDYTANGRSCVDAYLCAINCQFGACEPVCTQDLSGAGLAAYEALRACVDQSCPGPQPDLGGNNSDGGDPPDLGHSPCSGPSCAGCQKDAVNLECRDTLSACEATRP